MHSPLSGLRPCCARALKAAIAALFIFLAAHGAAAQEINPWKPSGTVYWIASPMRLNLGFTDENGTPRAAVVGSLSAQQLAGLPAGLLQAKGSDLFTPGHFDALWSAMKGGICNDVQQAIQTLENHSPNSPYNIQPCAMNPKGYLTANFQESWEDDSMNMVNGRRIRFTYQAPLNGVTFWMTSPHTCHVGANCPSFSPPISPSSAHRLRATRQVSTCPSSARPLSTLRWKPCTAAM
jgi:hypothetical protein